MVIINGTDTLGWRSANGGIRVPLGLSTGQTVQPLTDTITGILVDKRYDWLTADITAAPYIVPNGYDLIIKSTYLHVASNPFNPNFIIDGIIQIDPNPYGITIITSGQAISNGTPSGTGNVFINGFLKKH